MVQFHVFLGAFNAVISSPLYIWATSKCALRSLPGSKCVDVFRSHAVSVAFDSIRLAHLIVGIQSRTAATTLAFVAQVNKVEIYRRKLAKYSS